MISIRRKRQGFVGDIAGDPDFKKGSFVVVMIRDGAGGDSESFTLTETWSRDTAINYLKTMLVQASRRRAQGKSYFPADLPVKNPRRRRKATAKKKTTTRKKATRRKAKPGDRRRRYQYRATVKSRGARSKTHTFFALTDDKALAYSTGLMLQRLPAGSITASLKRTGKTRLGPAAVKKKVTRARGKGSAQ